MNSVPQKGIPMRPFASRISDWLRLIVPFLIVPALSVPPVRSEDAAGAAPPEEFIVQLAQRQQLQAKPAAVVSKRILMVVKHDDINVIFMAAPVSALSDEGDAADDEQPAPTRRVIIADSSCDQMLFGKDRNAATARCGLDDRLRQKVKLVDGLCELTDSQRKKLELAGRGDIHRFFERAAELRTTLQDIDGDQAGGNRELVALVVETSKRTEPMRRAVESGLFDDNSLFAKALKTTLTPAQFAQYEQRKLILPRVVNPRTRD
jgi:hypothetical protein